MALLIAVSKKEERDRNIGLFEAFSGLGFMTGPLVGSFLYTMGGYIMPFAFSGCFFILCFPLVAYQLAQQKRESKIIEENKAKSFTSTETLIQYSRISVLKMFTVPRFLFGIGSQIIIAATLQFLAPTLGLQLSLYGYTPEFVSLCFCIPSLIYAASSPFLFLVTEKIPKRLVMISGHILCALGMLIVGCSTIFGLSNDSNMILAGLCLLGFSASLIAIPVMPECLEAIEDRNDLNYDPEEVNNQISGIFVTSTGVGETLGPVASSVLNKYYGFNLA